jgi:hypothetical protein
MSWLRSLFRRKPPSPSGDLPGLNDLARVVTWCNCRTGPLGWIGTVSQIKIGALGRCTVCGFICTCDSAFVAELATHRAGDVVCTGWIPRHWLRRIPPVSELGDAEPESTEHCEEISA